MLLCHYCFTFKWGNHLSKILCVNRTNYVGKCSVSILTQVDKNIILHNGLKNWYHAIKANGMIITLKL